LGANSFLTKPMNFNDLVQLTKWVKGYWLHWSSEPEISRASVEREVIPDPKSSAEH